MNTYPNVVSIGCSYAINVTPHTFSFPSTSIEFLLDLVIYLKSKEIYNNKEWLVELTQIGRLTKSASKEIFVNPKYQTILNDHENVYNPHGFYKLGEKYYCSFIENEDEIKNNKLFPYEWWKTEREVHFSKSIEDHIKDYLNFVKKIQYELKDFNYTMVMMSNVFEGYFYDDGLLRHQYSDNIEYKVPNLEGSIHVKDLFPNEWNELDLSKFKFYETIGNKFGGLDEYTINNFEFEYFQDLERKPEDLNPFGMHPIHECRQQFYEDIVLK